MGRKVDLAELGDDELRDLLNDDSLPLARQLKVLDEQTRRATARLQAERLAELVAANPVLADLESTAETVREVQGWLEQAKWDRARAVRAALDAEFSLRTVASIARVAPSTVKRLRDEQLPPEPPPA